MADLLNPQGIIDRATAYTSAKLKELQSYANSVTERVKNLPQQVYGPIQEAPPSPPSTAPIEGPVQQTSSPPPQEKLAPFSLGGFESSMKYSGDIAREGLAVAGNIAKKGLSEAGAAIKNETTKTLGQFGELGKLGQFIDQKADEYAKKLESIPGFAPNPNATGFGALFSPGNVLRTAAGVVGKPLESLGAGSQEAATGHPLNAIQDVAMGTMSILPPTAPMMAFFNAALSNPKSKPIVEWPFKIADQLATAFQGTDSYGSIRQKFSQLTGVDQKHFDDGWHILSGVLAAYLLHKAIPLYEVLTTKNLQITPEESFNIAREITRGTPDDQINARPEVVEAMREIFDKGGRAVLEAIRQGFETRIPREALPELSKRLGKIFAEGFDNFKANQQGFVSNPFVTEETGLVPTNSPPPGTPSEVPSTSISPEQTTISGGSIPQGQIVADQEHQAQREELARLQAEKSGAIPGGQGVETNQPQLIESPAGTQENLFTPKDNASPVIPNSDMGIPASSQSEPLTRETFSKNTEEHEALKELFPKEEDFQKALEDVKKANLGAVPKDVPEFVYMHDYLREADKFAKGEDAPEVIKEAVSVANQLRSMNGLGVATITGQPGKLLELLENKDAPSIANIIRNREDSLRRQGKEPSKMLMDLKQIFDKLENGGGTLTDKEFDPNILYAEIIKQLRAQPPTHWSYTKRQDARTTQIRERASTGTSETANAGQKRPAENGVSPGTGTNSAAESISSRVALSSSAPTATPEQPYNAEPRKNRIAEKESTGSKGSTKPGDPFLETLASEKLFSQEPGSTTKEASKPLALSEGKESQSALSDNLDSTRAGDDQKNLKSGQQYAGEEKESSYNSGKSAANVSEKEKESQVQALLKMANDEGAKPPIGIQRTLSDVEGEYNGEFKIGNETKLQGFRRVVQDFNLRLKVLGARIQEVADIKELDEKFDLWAKKDMLPRKTADQLRRSEELKREFVSGLVKDGINLSDFDQYLHAKHAPERNINMANLAHDKGEIAKDNLSGMTDEKAQEVIQKVQGSGKLEQYEKHAQFIYKLLADTVENEIKNGLSKPEVRQLYSDAYKYYVPLFRNMEDIIGMGGSGTGSGSDIRGKESKRAKGSERAVLSVTGNAFYQYERAQVRIIKNEIGNTIMEMTERYPFLKDLFEVKAQTFTPKYNQDGELISLDPSMQLGENVLGTKKKGTQYFITIKDEEVAQALKNINLARVPGWFKYLRAPLGLWSALHTSFRPEFLITNAQRDIGEALANLGVEQGKLGKEKAKGLRTDIVKAIPGNWAMIWKHLRGVEKSAEFDEFLREGGDTGHFWSQDAQAIGETLEKFEKEMKAETKWQVTQNTGKEALKVVEDLNSSVELSTRFSTYQALKKRGFSVERAVQAAADLTVNFSRQGEIAPFLKSFYGFINPGIQGTDKTIRALKSKKVWMAVAGIAALGYFMDQLNNWLDPEGWATVPDWVKNHRLMIAYKGNQYTIWNMPYGYSSFFGLGSNISAIQNKTRTIKEATANIVSSTFDNFSPFDSSSNAYVPTLARPLADIQDNKNWYDAPIYPDQKFSDIKHPDYLTYYKHTGESVKWLASAMHTISGGFIDVHPNSLQYLFDQEIGGPVEFATASVAAVESAVKGEPFDPGKVPILRQFWKKPNYSAWAHTVVNDTFDTLQYNKLDPIQKERFFRALDKGVQGGAIDPTKAQQYRNEYFKAQFDIPVIDLSGGGSKVVQAYEQMKKMPAQDKQELLDNMSDQSKKELMKWVFAEKNPTADPEDFTETQSDPAAQIYKVQALAYQAQGKTVAQVYFDGVKANIDAMAQRLGLNKDQAVMVSLYDNIEEKKLYMADVDEFAILTKIQSTDEIKRYLKMNHDEFIANIHNFKIK